MIYYGTFLISGFWCWIAEILFKKKDQALGIVISAFSILVLTWLCGVRDFSIGTDIRVYGYNSFNIAANSLNLQQYLNSLNSIYGGSGNTEYGYLALNYIISRFTSNAHIFLFVLGLIINSVIFIAFYLFKYQRSITLSWLTFCFLFFGTTLNLLRQSVALAFVLLGIALLYKKKNKKSLISFIIAVLSHTSTIFAFLIYVFGLLVNRAKSKRALRGVFVFSTLLVLSVPMVITILNQRGLLIDKYYQYVLNDNSVGILTILIRVPMLLLIIYVVLRKRFCLNRERLWIYFLVIQEFLMLPLQSIGTTVARLMLFFGVAKIIAYPMLLENIESKDRVTNYLLKLGYLIFIMLIFYEQVIVSGNNQIYPFVFAIN